jgi:hypothetical protein
MKCKTPKIGVVTIMLTKRIFWSEKHVTDFFGGQWARPNWWVKIGHLCIRIFRNGNL